MKISQKNICAELYMDKSSVSKSIYLVNQGVIIRNIIERDSFKFGEKLTLSLFLND